MQCPICLEDLAPAAFRVLDCGNNHSICVTCLQGLEAGLGGAFATNEQGPRGALINYINLPGCPICRVRFHLAPHVADPMGRDNYQNNNPVATDLPRFYYDTQGLTAAEVQTWVIDAAANAVAAVNNLTDDDETEEEETEEKKEEQEAGCTGIDS